jgi:hypothetical protein
LKAIRILLDVTEQEGGERTQAEVEAFEIPGAGGAFAVHDCVGAGVGLGGRDGPPQAWVLTHVPSGWGLGSFGSRDEAAYFARQLHGAAPAVWALPDIDSIKRAMPAPLVRWAKEVLSASAAGVSPLLLKGYADFARDLAAAANAGKAPPGPALPAGGG